MQMIRNGFTLIELMVVVVAIGILAAIVVPKFANAHTEAAVTATGEDILAMTKALEHHNSSKGFWPAETAAGVAPPEIDSLFRGENPFLKSCPIGSVYDYDYKVQGNAKIVSISIKPTVSMPAPSIVDAQLLDTFLDDGVLNTGRFQTAGSGYTYRVSP